MVFFVLHSGKDKVSVCVCVCVCRGRRGGLHFALLSPPFLAMFPLFSPKKLIFKMTFTLSSPAMMSLLAGWAG